MLKGCDISNYQKVTPNGFDFYIIKASEGYGWTDGMMSTHYTNVQNMKKLAGFYHYARPDLGNSPESEADWFLHLVKQYTGHVIFALDWEGASLNYSSDWALRWLKRVYEQTGVRPVLYTSGSEIWSGKYKAIADANFGLWIAQWGVSQPTIKGGWNSYAIWQYSGSPLDLDYFNGDKNVYLKYCQTDKAATPKPNKKSIGEIASEVLQGKWGNGSERIEKLKQAGYNYNEVQAKVNEMTTQTKQVTDTLCLEVIQGKWGNGSLRLTRLKQAGYKPDEVQSRINTIYAVAQKVIKGEFGNGAQRQQLLRARGFDPQVVQTVVNKLW